MGDNDSSNLGSGWASGVLSVFLGAIGLGGVLVLWFPEWLSTERFRSHYPLALLRALLELAIGIAFLAGALSLALRRRKALGSTGCALSLAAALLGGGSVPIEGMRARPLQLGLDWFLLNLLLLAVVFVPLERAFPRWPDQGAFRPGWTTDGMHFLASHVLVQAITFLTLLPATTVARLGLPAALQDWVRKQPLLAQFLAIVLLADLVQYGIHRAFHRVPALWRFHAIHHSSRALDWLAGSRLHLVDVVATRGLVFLALFLAGFDERALYGYLAFVSFHAVLIHANVRFRFGVLDELVVTPRFHHWHHSAAPEARDRNFAVHLPWLDRLFGTRHLPAGAWPADYGIPGDPVPEGYVPQLLHPFRRSLSGRDAAR